MNSKIILIPFVICAISMVGQRIFRGLRNESAANLFRKIYVAGFALMWFGMLAVGMISCIREKNYGMMLYLLLFVVVGFFIIFKPRVNENAKFNFGIIISVGLVAIALLIGVFMVILGIMRQEAVLIFFGAFFFMGGMAFVLGGLTMKGCFDNCKIDVLGMYFGIVFIIIGIGFCVMVYQSSANIPKAVIAIPALMAAAGVLQVVKCWKNRIK